MWLPKLPCRSTERWGISACVAAENPVLAKSSPSAAAAGRAQTWIKQCYPPSTPCHKKIQMYNPLLWHLCKAQVSDQSCSLGSSTVGASSTTYAKGKTGLDWLPKPGPAESRTVSGRASRLCWPMVLANPKGYVALILLMEAEIKWPEKGHQTDQGPWSMGPRLFEECKRNVPAIAPVKNLLHRCVEGPHGPRAWLCGQPGLWALGTCEMLFGIHQLWVALGGRQMHFTLIMFLSFFDQDWTLMTQGQDHMWIWGLKCPALHHHGSRRVPWESSSREG